MYWKNTRIHNRNVTYETKKKLRLAINVMISMITNLKYGIVEAAEIAGNICGYSTERVRKYMAFSIITSMAAYSCLDDIW